MSEHWHHCSCGKSTVCHNEACTVSDVCPDCAEDGEEQIMVARIKYNKTPYMLPRGEHEGSNLRAFFGVRDDHDLYYQTEEGDDMLIENTDIPYFVEDGDKYYSVSRQINGG